MGTLHFIQMWWYSYCECSLTLCGQPAAPQSARNARHLWRRASSFPFCLSWTSSSSPWPPDRKGQTRRHWLFPTFALHLSAFRLISDACLDRFMVNPSGEGFPQLSLSEVERCSLPRMDWVNVHFLDMFSWAPPTSNQRIMLLFGPWSSIHSPPIHHFNQ